MGTIDLEKVALEIARKHLLEKVSFKELGELYFASPSTVQRHLMKWLEENRFELKDKLGSKDKLIVSRDDRLAEELVRKTGIWRARVVRISGPDNSLVEVSADREGVQAVNRASDELHRCLGEVAAEIIINNLRRNMTIGIASGRGVGFTIDGLKEKAGATPSWVSGYESIRLISLCGGAHLGQLQERSSRDFDADENVFALSSILSSPRQNVYYMTGPISTESKNPDAKINPRFDLDMAILGLGQLNEHHHYFRDHTDLQLKNLSNSLQKILEWQKENPEFMTGVAEIVLRLYPATVSESSSELVEIINETNNHLLAIHPEKIRNAGEVVLVAGGKQKTGVLRGILTGKYPDAPIKKGNLTLVTDAVTAEELIKG